MSHTITDAGYLPEMAPMSSKKDKDAARGAAKTARNQAKKSRIEARVEARKSRSDARKTRSDARRSRGRTRRVTEGEDLGSSYTIDELAAHTNVPSRTIRFYQAQKILDKPRRKGRVAVYTEAHVTRLQAIAKLQDRGLRIRGMKQLLAGGDGEAAVNEWLGLSEKLSTPWTDDRAKAVDEEQMARIIGERPAGTLAAIVGAGLAERPDDAPGTYFIASPGLLDVALRLLDAGLNIEVLSQVEPIVRAGLRGTAESVVDYFIESGGLREPGEPAREQQLTCALEALRSLGANAVGIIFAQEVERTLNSLLENGTPTKSGDKKPRRRRRARRRRSRGK